MEVRYSILDTIEEYDSLFKEFHKEYSNYPLLEKNKKLIYLAAGLGLSNSIHERFIKAVINEYIKVISLSNNKKDLIIRKYKAPNRIRDFVELLNLDLNEAFNLMKSEIQENYSHIDSFLSLITIISDQRSLRNDYLHGDFNFSNDVELFIFKENVMDFQEIHNFLFKMIKYSFYENISVLPDISKLIPNKTKRICNFCGKELPS